MLLLIGLIPQDGLNGNDNITRINESSFNLLETGTYQVYFNVPVSTHLIIMKVA